MKVKDYEFFKQGYKRIIGIDEAGRGCWAGPVSVGMFILNPDTKIIKDIDDSKKISFKKREGFHDQLAKFEYKVYFGELDSINELGIGKTIENIISDIVAKYSDNGTMFLIDGQFAKNFGEHTLKIIKGDSIYYSISAASILAKVKRDRLMIKLHKKYPNYFFHKHKGYGTLKHRQLIKKHGICDLHRRSFKPIKLLEFSNSPCSFSNLIS